MSKAINYKNRTFGFRICRLVKKDFNVGGILNRKFVAGWDLGESEGFYHSFEEATKAFRENEYPNLILFFDPFDGHDRIVVIADRVNGKTGWISNTLILQTGTRIVSETSTAEAGYDEVYTGIWKSFESSLVNGTFITLKKIVLAENPIGRKPCTECMTVMRANEPQGRPCMRHQFY